MINIQDCKQGEIVKIDPPMEWGRGIYSHYGMIEKIQGNIVYVLVQIGARDGISHQQTIIQCSPDELSPDARQ